MIGTNHTVPNRSTKVHTVSGKVEDQAEPMIIVLLRREIKRRGIRQFGGNYARVKRMDRNADTKRLFQQPSCSQPQPISITPDFSAFSQYSPQYLLPSSGRQSQAGCAHLDSFSAMWYSLVLSTVLRDRKTAAAGRQDVTACDAK